MTTATATGERVILVVDDTPTAINVMRSILEDVGYRVLVATSGERALRRAATERPDLILLDVLMPELDGYETCRRLKAQESTRDIPIVFLSALNETVDRVKAFGLGAVDFITKPFQVEEVLARVKTHLALQNAREELERRVEERTAELAQVNRFLKNPLEYLTSIAPSYGAGGRTGAKPAIEFESLGKLLEDMGTKILGQIADLRELNAQLEVGSREKDALLRELYHRTKNNMQVICSLLSIQADRLEDSPCKAVLKDMENRIYSMSLVHEKLYQSHNLSSIGMKEYLTDLVELLARSHDLPGRNVAFDLELDDVHVSIDSSIPTGLLVTELITNALKHAFVGKTQGRIRVGLHERDGLIELSVSDDGRGFPSGFDWKKAETMGLQTIDALGAHQLQGRVQYSTEGGVACTIEFRDAFGKTRI